MPILRECNGPGRRIGTDASVPLHSYGTSRRLPQSSPLRTRPVALPAQFAGSADGRDLGAGSACALGLRLVDARSAATASLTGIPELVGDRPPLDAGAALAFPARVLVEADARHPIVPERAIASSM